MLVRCSARQRARKERQMAQWNPEEVFMREFMAAGGEIPPDMADKLVEEGIASAKHDYLRQGSHRRHRKLQSKK